MLPGSWHVVVVPGRWFSPGRPGDHEPVRYYAGSIRQCLHRKGAPGTDARRGSTDLQPGSKPLEVALDAMLDRIQSLTEAA
jgi:hypothetical protein